jgi:hypothetical protein
MIAKKRRKKELGREKIEGWDDGSSWFLSRAMQNEGGNGHHYFYLLFPPEESFIGGNSRE